MIKGWRHLRFWKDPWREIEEFLEYKQDQGAVILPDRKNWFKALELTPPSKVRCVILGQDPYPTKGHANGLAFSTYPHVSPLPRSLANILKEYQDDLGFDKPKTGDLTPWAEEGVLLLNTILTVEKGKPLSHAGIGWEKLTFEIVRTLGDRQDIVFCLWGKRAQEYAGAVSEAMVLKAPHPSPYSANTGFFGSKPFSRVNNILVGHGLKPISWRLT